MHILYRLQGEKVVYDLIKRVEVYMEPRFYESHPELVCGIYLRRIEHLYYKVLAGWLACIFSPFFKRTGIFWMDIHVHVHVHVLIILYMYIALFPESPPANALVTFELTRIFSCEGVQRLSVLVHKIGEPWDEANVNINCHVQLYIQ